MKFERIVTVHTLKELPYEEKLRQLCGEGDDLLDILTYAIHL